MFPQPTRKHGKWLVSAAMVMTLVGLFVASVAQVASASDIVWHNSATNEIQLWGMFNQSVSGRATVLGETGQPAFVGLPWSIVGTGDFNGDGQADLVWHNSATGETQLWLMNGYRVTGRATVLGETGKPAYVGLPWSIVGAGDFNGDGKADIAWHNSTTGETQLWLMNGYRVTGRATVLGEDGKPTYVGLPWSIVGTGYFNGNSKSDLVWHNSSTGETQLWLMDGARVTGRRTVLGETGQPAFVGLPWSIVGAGDFNGDGKADLVWHNSTTGETQLWLMSGYRVTGRATVLGEDGSPAHVGLPWSIVGIKSFTQDRLLAAASLEDFGYGHMKVGGVAARGTRPLVTILTQFAGKPPLAHDRAYFDNLIYNTLQHSVNGYYITNSRGRFFWGRAGEGTIGPFNFTAAEGNLPERQRLARIKEVAIQSGFNFAQFDDNRDGEVSSEELGILIIDNLSERGAAKRSTDPVSVRPSGSVVGLSADVAAAAHRASLMSFAHELSHLLGTVDLYGSNGLSQGLTLMGATIFDQDDDRTTWHLDPWHKMQLGWCEPRIRSLRTPGTEALPAATTIQPDAPVILYDPARGVGEYFLLEYRTPAYPSGLHYDEDVADTGLVIWHVQQDANKQLLTVPSLAVAGQVDSTMFAEGAPDFARGGNTAWHSRAVVPMLRWLDGSSTGVRVQTRPFAATDNSIIIDWGDVRF